MIQWHTKAGNTSTNIKVEIVFTLTELSATNVVTRNFHLGDSSKGRYNMILGIDRLKIIRITFKWSDDVVKVYGGTFKESMAPMVGLGMHKFKYLNTGKLTPDESFMNAYT